MRYSKDHKTETRDRILQVASRRFRKEGIDAVGVASLMSSAGLTHGGFYAHFASKEDLVDQACEKAFETTVEKLRAVLAGTPPGSKLARLTSAYLSPQHRDHPEDGCVAAAVSAEIGRHATATRQAFGRRLAAMVDLVAEALQADGGNPQAATGIVATLVGAMTLARAVDDLSQSESLLQQARAAVMAAGRPAAS